MVIANRIVRRSCAFILLTLGLFSVADYSHANTGIFSPETRSPCGTIREGINLGVVEFGSVLSAPCSVSTTRGSLDIAGGVNAFAFPGRLGVAASVIVSGNVEPNFATSNPGGQVFEIAARDFEILTVSNGPATGYVRFHVVVNGTGSVSVSTESDSTEPFPIGAAQIIGNMRTDSQFSQFDRLEIGDNIVDVGFRNSRLIFDLELKAIASCSNVRPPVGNACNTTVSALNSATILGGQIFDNDGNLYSSAMLTSNSGFDYLEGHEEPSAPIANAGQYEPIEATSSEGAMVQLDGSGSEGAEEDELTYNWSLDLVEIASGETPLVTLPLGNNTVTLVVSDGDLSDSAEVVIEVVDTTPPTIEPPAAITIEAIGPTTTVALGNATASDIAGGVAVTNDAPVVFEVESETTVTWTARDDAGNTSSATQLVTIQRLPVECVDSDGDGWGWDGSKSCKIDSSEYICVDTDGDGWGWNGFSSCRPPKDIGKTPCIDTDGDGWGWTGTASCRVSQ